MEVEELEGFDVYALKGIKVIEKKCECIVDLLVLKAIEFTFEKQMKCELKISRCITCESSEAVNSGTSNCNFICKVSSERFSVNRC